MPFARSTGTIIQLLVNVVVGRALESGRRPTAACSLISPAPIKYIPLLLLFFLQTIGFFSEEAFYCLKECRNFSFSLIFFANIPTKLLFQNKFFNLKNDLFKLLNDSPWKKRGMGDQRDDGGPRRQSASNSRTSSLLNPEMAPATNHQSGSPSPPSSVSSGEQPKSIPTQRKRPSLSSELAKKSSVSSVASEAGSSIAAKNRPSQKKFSFSPEIKTLPPLFDRRFSVQLTKNSSFSTSVNGDVPDGLPAAKNDPITDGEPRATIVTGSRRRASLTLRRSSKLSTASQQGAVDGKRDSIIAANANCNAQSQRDAEDESDAKEDVIDQVRSNYYCQYDGMKYNIYNCATSSARTKLGTLVCSNMRTTR